MPPYTQYGSVEEPKVKSTYQALIAITVVTVVMIARLINGTFDPLEIF